MIVLDTNVLSEPLKSQPSAEVLRWIAATDAAATTSVSVGELLTGVGLLPAGRRREGLQAAIEQTLTSFSEYVFLTTRPRRGRTQNYRNAAVRSVLH